MQVLTGTSGYSYREWKGKFYPEDLPAGDMLSFYAGRFQTVEVNNTFYRMPTPDMLEKWLSQVGEDFAFSVKAPRRITHQGRLGDVEEPLSHLFETLAHLGDHLGPVLFQLPPFLRLDLPRLEKFLSWLPEDRLVAMEFRHISWFEDRVYAALRARNVALCHADGQLKDEVPLVPTADWGYLRLRRVAYEDDALSGWVTAVTGQEWRRAFVFFKHEDEATGPALAVRFADLVA